jgi:TRAP-type C4-dicarboxylate transport system permease small subunit
LNAAPDDLARGFARIRRSAAALAGLGVVAITLLGTADVGGRFLLSQPLLGQVETTRILLVYLAFVGLAEAEAGGGHVRLGLLDPLLSPRARALRECLVQALATAVAAVVTGSAAVLAWDSFRVGETMIAPIPLPAWLARLGVTIGFLLFTVELALGLLHRIRAWTRS